ncbi:diguanylate cyclase domain-containing protein [Variovorax sp. HJSM1_2]|uniref:diguanylate cyclase domain-containing protein n=1 Tax=Variovorax sp. HJSM1_2 TaxID=3366263 RepID=UPI003BCCCD01
MTRSLDNHTFFKQAWTGLGFFLGLTLGLGILQLYLAHIRLSEEESGRLQIQASVLAENLASQFEGVDNALTDLGDALVGNTPGAAPPASSRLKALAEAMPAVRGIAVLDATGTVILSDQAAQRGKNFRDLAYFAVPQKDRDLSRMYVSPPFRSADGVYSVNLSKAVLANNGKFAGVVTASLNPRYFETLAKAVLYAPDMQASLVHSAGRVFVDARHDEVVLGSDLHDGKSLFSQHVASGREESTFEGATDDERMTVLRTAAPVPLRMDAPLVVQLSRKPSAIYAGWQVNRLLGVALFVLVAVGSVAALFLAQRRAETASLGAQERARLERENALRLEFGLESAGLGLWDLRLDLNALTVNDRELEMLGYRYGEVELSVEHCRSLVHPDDLKSVYVGFQGHLKTSFKPYRVMHRMLHKDGRVIWVLAHILVMEVDQHGAPVRILGTHLDITERMQTDAALRDSEQRLALAMETGNMGLVDWHVTTDEVLFNDRAYEVLGLKPGAVALSFPQWIALRHPDDVEQTNLVLQKMLKAEVATADIEYRVCHADGHYLWVHLRAEAIERGPKNEPLRVMATFRDVDARKAAEFELKRVNEQLELLTVTDGLTGVGNRRLFDKTLHDEWQRCARQGLPLGLLMIDIDHFKKYNDHYGHQGGDAALAGVAQILKKCVKRSGELVARYGGEEFSLLLPGSDAAAAAVVAQRCVAAVQAAQIPHDASPVSPWVSLSIGVASWVPIAGLSPEDFLKAADAALYEAKDAGRNRFEVAKDVETVG